MVNEELYTCPVCGHVNDSGDVYQNYINDLYGSPAFSGHISVKCNKCNALFRIEFKCHVVGKDVCTDDFMEQMEAEHFFHSINKRFGFMARFQENPERYIQSPINYQRITEIPYPVAVSEKYDGVYCLYHDGHIYGKIGEEYTSMQHLVNEFSQVENLKGHVVIFEAYIPNTPEPIISGKCRDTKEQHTDVIAMVHDVLTESEFLDGNGRDFQTRVWFSPEYNIPQSEHIKVVEHFEVATKEELLDFTQKIWERGGEGVVARELISQYKPGSRNKEMFKLKKTVSFDLKCVAVEEGTGKDEGTLGVIICEDKNGKTVRCYNGFSAAERASLWNYNNLIVGKIVRIDGMELTHNGVIREPRYGGIRFDKKIADAIE